MSAAYHRMVQLIDPQGLSLVLEHALDRSVIIKLCNTYGHSYAGVRTKSVPFETLVSDLARDCFDKEATGTQVIKILAKASAQEINQVRQAKSERVRSFIEQKQNATPRECCRLSVAILLDDRKDLHATGVDLLNKTAQFSKHPRPGSEHLTESEFSDEDTGVKKQIHDLNQALIATRSECGRLAKQNRSLEARMAQLKSQCDEIRANYETLLRPRQINNEPESLPASSSDHTPLLQSVEKNIDDIKQTVQTTARTIEDEYRSLKQTMGTLQKEIRTLRDRERADRRPAPARRGGQPENERLGIFVDVQNMFYAAKQYGARLDFEKLMSAAVGDRRLVRAYAYVIQTPEVDQTGFVTMLQQRSYQVKRKDLRLRSDGSAKGDWDMGMAIDMIGMADKVDVIVLVSGDGDFVSLVQLLKEMGPRVEVFSFPHNTARDLMETADRYYPIDETLLIKMDQRNGTQETTPAPHAEENGQSTRSAGG